ncbi:MAG: sigma-70 family RNA polymerase sigma factor [Methylobacterium sp.]
MIADPPEGATEAAPTHGASDVGRHLSAPLKDYFALTTNDALPEGLSGLVTRLETLFAGADAALAFDFRADIINALPALRTFALSLCGDAIRADDLVQEAFARAWANQHRFRPGTNFTAWLFTILRNLFYSDLRKAKREVEDADGVHAERMVALSDQEDASTLNTVREHLNLLPAAQREALLLVGAEGFTYEEAADRIGCQVGTVKSRVSRARATLLAGLGILKESAGEGAIR